MRPLADPVPLYAWSMALRRDAESEGLTALREAAAELAATESWLARAGEHADDTWLPEPDASRLANREFRVVTEHTKRLDGRPP
jgi:hypothetical protein